MTIRVNGREISQHDIDQESAAFSGGDPHQARQQATAALIIRTLLLDHSQQGWEADEATADAAIEALLAREIVAPVPTIAACRRYYQANLERFHSPPLVAARHILLARPRTTQSSASEPASGRSICSVCCKRSLSALPNWPPAIRPVHRKPWAASWASSAAARLCPNWTTFYCVCRWAWPQSR